MTAYICTTCGTQFAPRADAIMPAAPAGTGAGASADAPPDACPICSDERQYVPAAGQSWTTLDALRRGHRNAFQQIEPGLIGIGTTPDFAIGQRALLVRTPDGNYLWDCIALVDDATVAIVEALGGLRGIAISHPHYYTTMVEWSRALGGVPIWLHDADRQWVMRPDAAIRHWDGPRRDLAPGLTLIHCGGHFEGGTVLHWSAGAAGRGALLSGDIVQALPDPRAVSFMRSYPNLIPLPAHRVQHIVRALDPFPFDNLYGAWWHRHVTGDAKTIVSASAQRYIAALV